MAAKLTENMAFSFLIIRKFKVNVLALCGFCVIFDFVK